MTAEVIALSGHTDAIDILNSLPQSVINAGVDCGNDSTPNNAAGGFATDDLRREPECVLRSSVFAK